MAFPASPSNNQVHKESGQNRAWVYDSATGTWDQVRETDRTENKILQGEIGGAVTGTLGSGVTFPSGHIIQVVDSKKTDTSSVNAAAWTDIGGTDQDGSGTVWCCKITPKATSSKILVCAGISYGRSNGNLSAGFLWFRDSTQIFRGNEAGSRIPSWCAGYSNSDHWNQSASVQFLDSPNTTSQVTYKVQYRSESTSLYTLINRGYNDSNATHNGWRGASVITLMEIAG